MNIGRTVAETPVAEKLAALTALGTPGVIRLEPSISALAASLSRRALAGRTGGGVLPPTAGAGRIHGRLRHHPDRRRRPSLTEPPRAESIYR
jgi:hypothetical protein